MNNVDWSSPLKRYSFNDYLHTYYSDYSSIPFMAFISKVKFKPNSVTYSG